MGRERPHKGRVRVFHQNAGEAQSLLDAIGSAGYLAIHHSTGQGLSTRAIAESGTLAAVIDLSRLPSHGRAVAAWLRNAKGSRNIPLIFVGGASTKIDAIQKEIPDATYVSPAELISALRKAKGPTDPVVPPKLAARGRTTAQKLGIKEGMRVKVIDPPNNYLRVLGALPVGAAIDEETGSVGQLTLWFVHDPKEFEAALVTRRKLAVNGPLWMIWRKGRRDGLNGNFVRAAGLQMGLVDYKICSLDETWSGMLFAVKKARSNRHAR